MKRLAVLVLFAAVASASAGDDDKAKVPPAPAAPPAPTAPTSPKASEQPKKDAPADESAEPVAPVRGARYRVTLKTGRAIVGVVVADHVFERRDGLNWNLSEKAADGAGVRIFFVKDQEGFVFVTTKELRAAEKIGDVTAEEGKVLAQQHIVGVRRADGEREHLRKEKAAREESAKAKAAEDAVKVGVEGDKSKAPAAAPQSPEDQIARYTALLLKFPPGRFTPDTPKEIEKRRIVMDLFPTDEEKEFLAVFAEWSKAYAAWQAGQEKPAPTASAPAAGK